jgi:hypothetical protein
MPRSVVLSRWFVLFAAATLWSLAPGANPAHAMCEPIPLALDSEFRGALGTVDRPYAIPNDEGQDLTVRLGTAACGQPPTSFVDFDSDGDDGQDDHYVTVLFTPPSGGPRNGIVYTTTQHLGACQTLADSCSGDLGGGAITCRAVGIKSNDLEVIDSNTLRFRFPDTDIDFNATQDDRTFTGPATIAITPITTPLPCELATTSCGACLSSNGACVAQPNLIACIDDLYDRADTCNVDPATARTDRVFPHFTALPPANDYGALCTSSGSPCADFTPPPASRELRFTIDEAGNALLPMDYRRIQARFAEVPIPRILRGRPLALTDFNAIPGDSLVGSFSTGGVRLPPLLAVLPEAVNGLPGFFGTVDAPIGVLRVSRRAEGLRECFDVSDVARGMPCDVDDDCILAGDDYCGVAACYDAGVRTQQLCSSDAQCGGGQECGPGLFDFTADLDSGSGPIVRTESQFVLEAENPISSSGIFEADEAIGFVVSEPIDGTDLNGDMLARDHVVRVRDTQSGRVRPIGIDVGGTPADGRAVTRIKQYPFQFPVVAAEGDLVAFLEPEPLQPPDPGVTLTEDKNQDNDIADSILRVFRVEPDCGGAGPCAVAVPVSSLTAVDGSPLAASTTLAVDPTPIVNARGLAFGGGTLFFRASESENTAHSLTLLRSIGSRPSISANGRYVAFDDYQYLLDSEAPDNCTIRVNDRVTGSNVAAWSGADPAISDDGGRVVFELNTAGAACGKPVWPGSGNAPNSSFDRELHVQDIGGSQFNLSAGQQTDSWMGFTEISGNGQIAVATRRATGANYSLKVVEIATNSVIFGTPGDGWGQFPLWPSLSMSGLDGLFVQRTRPVIESMIGNFDNPPMDTDGSCCNSEISRDQRFVAFQSDSELLVGGDTNSLRDAFVLESATGRFERMSVDSSGEQRVMAGVTANPANHTRVSEDGRYVLFDSRIYDLAIDPAGNSDTGGQELYRHDRLTGIVSRVSTALGGAAPADLPPDSLSPPDLSANGHHVTWRSETFKVWVHGPDLTDLTSDLSGDGDIQDNMLMVMEPTGAVTALCPAQDVVALPDGRAVFLRPESDGVATGCPVGPTTATDLNDDGDSDDLIVHLYDPGLAPGNPIVNLIEAASAMDASTAAIAIIAAGPTPELRFRSFAVGSWTALGISALDVRVSGPVAAFRQESNQELYSFSNSGLKASGLPALEFAVAGNAIAFQVQETTLPLNNDGDTDDAVLHVMAADTGAVQNSGFAAIPCPTASCDPRTPFEVSDSAVLFITPEADQQPVGGCPGGIPGCDLDGDGRSDGFVKHVFNLNDSSVHPIAGVDGGLCTNNGEACVSDAQCGSGTCYIPPGLCVEQRGICDPVDPLMGCTGAEECVPDGAGGFVCEIAFGGCTTDTECLSPAVCRNLVDPAFGLAGSDLHQILPPVRDDPDGDEVLMGAGTCVQVGATPCTSNDDCGTAGTCGGSGVCISGPCSTDSECGPKEICGLTNECVLRLGSCADRSDCPADLDLPDDISCEHSLNLTGAADSDGDLVLDVYDNCPDAMNADQSDSDADDIGDVCDLAICGDGIQQYEEGCDSVANCVSCQIVSGTACNDGVDNDGDGYVDFGDDPGCVNAADTSEREAGLACDDGVSQDDDLDVDQGDAGCYGPASASESPECDDGIDNDGDGRVDFSGGSFGEPEDPNCGAPWYAAESASASMDWVFHGTAQGGSVDLTIEGVFLSVPTTLGQSSQDVASAIAVAINGHLGLQAAGITAASNGNIVSTNGDVTSHQINDPGLSHGVPALNGPALLALVLLLSGAGGWLSGMDRTRRSSLR